MCSRKLSTPIESMEDLATVSWRTNWWHFVVDHAGGVGNGLQDLQSWTRDGIAGLQSVVLYSLPELDGAIDTVPLGGLVGDNIYLVTERVRRLSDRIKKWVKLRRTPPKVRTPVLCLAPSPSKG